MPDFTDEFNPFEELAPRESDNSVKIKRWLYKYSNDDVAVYNPLDEDYRETYDLIVYRFPAKSKTVIKRYVAENYVSHMIDKILFGENDRAVNKENERRAKLGQSPMNKWAEQGEFEAKLGILTNAKKREELFNMLFLGTVKKFGEEDVLMGTASRPEPRVNVSDMTKLMHKADKMVSMEDEFVEDIGKGSNDKE